MQGLGSIGLDLPKKFCFQIEWNLVEIKQSI